MVVAAHEAPFTRGIDFEWVNKVEIRQRAEQRFHFDRCHPIVAGNINIECVEDVGCRIESNYLQNIHHARVVRTKTNESIASEYSTPLLRSNAMRKLEFAASAHQIIKILFVHFDWCSEYSVGIAIEKLMANSHLPTIASRVPSFGSVFIYFENEKIRSHCLATDNRHTNTHYIYGIQLRKQ